MNNTTIKLTYQDYLQISDDLNRHEIIDGEHYVTPSPMFRHQRVLSKLFFKLFQWVEDHELGVILPAPIDVVLSDIDIVVPDIIFISKPRLTIKTEKNIQGSPELVIEILSPSTASRDIGIKKRLYEKYGVAEYWVVDPDRKTVSVFTLVNEKFSNSHQFSVKDKLASDQIPGLQISLSSIFKD
ncbi:MAG: Uma2 family endonuclease [Nitrospiria bacterium]